LVSCENPFFPPVPETSRPMEAVDQRKSPIGVIKLLIKAYEYKNIGLYTSLLRSDFRFYVESGFAIANEDRIANNSLIPELNPYPTLQNINPGTYYYWDYKTEVTKTNALFSNTISIEVDQYGIDAPNYIDSIPNDSLFAEVKVVDLMLDVTIKFGDEIKIKNEPQIFVLRKEVSPSDSLSKIWVIWRWYDLGSKG
jgi:hypothetical protein